MVVGTMRTSVFFLLFAACAAPIIARGPALVAPRGAIDLTDDGDVASLLAAVEESVQWDPRDATMLALRDFLRTAPDAAALSAFVAARYEVREAAGGANGSVLFTGYYEPVIDASLVKDDVYATPIYGSPTDLVEARLHDFNAKFAANDKIVGRLVGNTLVPYWSRAEITLQRVLPDSLAIAWARDPVDVFFAEVQGSASLRFPDGRTQRIGYVAKNGRAYKSLGGKLIADNQMKKEDVSMQSIRAWLAAHGNDLLVHNESYVFFRFLPGAPLGALGRPVTPGRSIATDLSVFPKGALAFLSLALPMPDGTQKPYRRFVLNQDTGGAIVGPGRADIFFGQGELAEHVAGHLKAEGRLLFLVPKLQPGVSAHDGPS